MRDCIYIGPTPNNEDCAQVGADDYFERSRKEMKIFQEQILRAYPIPEGLDVSLGIKEGEVVVYYDADAEEVLNEKTGEMENPCLQYALLVEGDPESKLREWDSEAQSKLTKPESIKLKKGEYVLVDALTKKCDFCDELAEYDARTKQGCWANMCGKHFGQHGVGQLGTGYGQKFVLRSQINDMVVA